MTENQLIHPHQGLPLISPCPLTLSAVRRRCLGVLSHLILNDMMKIKGHIARIAMCMRDGEDPEVARMAKAFFSPLVSVGIHMHEGWGGPRGDTHGQGLLLHAGECWNPCA